MWCIYIAKHYLTNCTHPSTESKVIHFPYASERCEKLRFWSSSIFSAITHYVTDCVTRAPAVNSSLFNLRSFFGARPNVWTSNTASRYFRGVEKIIALPLRPEYLSINGLQQLGSSEKNVLYMAAVSGFPEELKFTTPVNLADSKIAFTNLLSGLDNPSDFVRMWSFKPHDPWNYPNPIGDVDVSNFIQRNDRPLPGDTRK